MPTVLASCLHNHIRCWRHASLLGMYSSVQFAQRFATGAYRMYKKRVLTCCARYTGLENATSAIRATKKRC